MSSHSCDAIQGCLERPKSLAAIVAGQNTYVVSQVTDQLRQVPHGALIQVHMHVAYVQYGEILKRRRQLFKPDVIVPDENALCISARAPIETGQFQRDTNDRMRRVPVLDVKEVE